MKPITVTFVSSYNVRHNGEIVGDVFERIVAIGYDERKAKIKALDELINSCGKDFTTPVSCKPGTRVDYFAAKGYQLEAGESVDDAEEKLAADSNDFEFAVSFEFEGSEYAFRDKFSEFMTGGSILSSDVRRFDSWTDVEKWLGISQ